MLSDILLITLGRGEPLSQSERAISNGKLEDSYAKLLSELKLEESNMHNAPPPGSSNVPPPNRRKPPPSSILKPHANTDHSQQYLPAQNTAVPLSERTLRVLRGMTIRPGPHYAE